MRTPKKSKPASTPAPPLTELARQFAVDRELIVTVMTVDR
jgi:hypothetical protein